MRRIEVRLDWGETPLVVGTLAEHGGRILFEYAEEFIADPLPISPFHLPVQPGVRDESSRIFSGLHGVFNDSLPDGWGLMLMDRHFRQQGLDTSRSTPLDRLAWIHTRGMGALTYHPAKDQPEESQDLLNLADLAREADSVTRGEATAILPQLRLAGGSPGTDTRPPSGTSGVQEDGVQRIGRQPGRPCQELRFPHVTQWRMAAGASL